MARKRISRTPRGYEGTQVTTHHVGDLLTSFLGYIREAYQERPDLVLAAWPEVIGPKLAPMTQATSFCNGILTVKVGNSTLHSLLSRHDKFRILRVLQKKFPKSNIQNIVFRIA